MATKKTTKKPVEDTGDDLIAPPAEPVTVDPVNAKTYDSAPPASPVMTLPTVPVEVVKEKKSTPKKRVASSTSKKTSD